MKYLSEYLEKLARVTLTLEFDEAKPSELRVEDSVATIVYHSNEPTQILLPYSSEKCVTKFEACKQNNGSYAFRFPAVWRPKKKRSDAWLRVQIWSASELNTIENLEIKCKHCQKLIFSCENLTKFRPLPSEHWAELMDFWHCHRPHESSDIFNPGYAVGKFEPKRGYPLVGTAYLLLNTKDAQGCEHCAVDKDTLKVYKWDLMVSSRTQSLTHSASEFVGTILFELINSHAIYTFSLRDPGRTCEALVWVFNQEMEYTHSGMETPLVGMKVYFALEKSEINALRGTRPEIEEVELPYAVMEELILALKNTNASLPRCVQTFGGWKLSYLV